MVTNKLDRPEKIGNVLLNYKFYNGTDQYSDGEIEEELLKIVQENEDYCEIISHRVNWPIMYHLSKERENIVSWIEFKKNSEILEIGAGCGAITGCLCEKAKSVTAVELSKRRSLINAYKNKKYNNLEIIVGNFETVYQNLQKKYDYITLIGVLEYAPLYVQAAKPFETLLKNANHLLNTNGEIIIAIENRFGLKYFAGCKEDHLGKPFIGIEGYDCGRTKVQTFNKKELIQLFKNAGFLSWDFFYPYPDYKFPECIYSDVYLPQKGELVNNERNFDSNRLRLFDETKAFDTIIDSEYFTDFSNSFLIRIKKKED